MNEMQRESIQLETDRFERDRLDYETTVKRFEQITDTRFKLIGLVPTVTGIGAFAADANKRTPDSTMVIGILGLLVVVGIIIYEIRNTQLYDALWFRAICLEASMRFRSPYNAYQHGGPFLGQPQDRRTLLKRPRLTIRLGHTLALAIVYGTSVGVWSWVIASGAFAKAAAHPALWPWAISSLAGITAGWALFRLRNSGDPRIPGYMDDLLHPTSSRRA